MNIQFELIKKILKERLELQNIVFEKEIGNSIYFRATKDSEVICFRLAPTGILFYKSEGRWNQLNGFKMQF